MAPKSLTPAQKAAAKTFVKLVRDLERSTKLPRKEFVKLLGLPETTYRCWFSRKTLPSEQTQAAVRKAADTSYTRLSVAKNGFFDFLALTAWTPGEVPAKD